MTPDAAAPRGLRRRSEISPFLIGKYEVTTRQFRECVVQKGCPVFDRRALEGADDQPVRYVAWDEAEAYCRWLEGAIEGSGLLKMIPKAEVSLPTEDEWELAAAGETGRRYPWGATFDALAVNGGNAGRSGVIGVGRLVRGATPNGLFDMSGNVAEWTTTEPIDVAFTGFRGAVLDRPRLPKIVRGGSFYDGPSLLTTGAAMVADGGTGYDFVGFRVVIAQRISRTATGS